VATGAAGASSPSRGTAAPPSPRAPLRQFLGRVPSRASRRRGGTGAGAARRLAARQEHPQKLELRLGRPGGGGGLGEAGVAQPQQPRKVESRRDRKALPVDLRPANLWTLATPKVEFTGLAQILGQL
jgi:hypothetical protein